MPGNKFDQRDVITTPPLLYHDQFSQRRDNTSNQWHEIGTNLLFLGSRAATYLSMLNQSAYGITFFKNILHHNNHHRNNHRTLKLLTYNFFVAYMSAVLSSMSAWFILALGQKHRLLLDMFFDVCIIRQNEYVCQKSSVIFPRTTEFKACQQNKII